MESRAHIPARVGVNACRFFLGAVFVFSGFVKAVDPMGTFYKVQDYLTAFGWMEFFPKRSPLLVAVALPALEFWVGVCVFFGICRKASSRAACLFMLVMTPLTLYVALANPVADCGCFGDAWVLTNWQTFGKNVLLLAAAAVVWRWKTLVVRFLTDKMEWMLSLYSLLFIAAVMSYCLNGLPVIDFRPYKVGNNIRQLMEMPEGAKPSVYESRFVLEKEGVRQTFTLDNYPDSTWRFVRAESVLVEKGYEPPIPPFSLVDAESGEDVTERVWNDSTYTFLLVAHRLEEADEGHIDLINELYDYSRRYGYLFYGLTASSPEEIERWRDRAGAEYPFCRMDEVELKTMVRSNPGVLLLKGGTVVNKWSDNRLPNEFVLTGGLDSIEPGQAVPASRWRVMGGVVGWFAGPFLLIWLIDALVVRRQDRKRKDEPLTTNV